MTIRLTKTQQALIARARTYGGAFTVECGSGRGAQGGRVSYGSRERAALHKLRDLGLVRIVNTQSDREHNRGYCVFTTSIRYELTAN